MSHNNNDDKNNSDLIINSGSKSSHVKKLSSEMKDVSKSTSCSSIPITNHEPEINNKHSRCISVQNFDNDRQKNCAERRKSDSTKEKNQKYGSSLYNKSAYNKTSKHPLLRKKSLPVPNNFTNTSAKVVLFERTVEIKDLESKVKYLQNKIKKLEAENKTLQIVQARHERELQKYRDGVANIPSLLKSHKGEAVVYESTISNYKKEISDSKKEIKSKNEILMKKDSQIDKLTTSLRKSEKNARDLLCELKELRSVKGNLEKENDIMSQENEELKNENASLHKKVEELLGSVEHLKDNLNNEMNLSKQLKTDFNELQKKCEAEKLRQIEDSRTLAISDLAAEVSNNILPENSIKNDSKHENKYLENLPVNDQHEKTTNCDKSVEKTSCNSVDTFICCQTLCNVTKSYSDIRVRSTNNLRILPPLIKDSEIKVNESNVKESVSVPAEDNLKNRNKDQFEVVTKDFFVNILSKETELDSSKNTDFSSNLTKKELQHMFVEPLKGKTKFQTNAGYSDVNNEIKTSLNESDKSNKEMKLSRCQKKIKKPTYFGDNFKDFLFNNELKTDVSEVEKIYKKTAALKYSVKKKL